MIKVEFLAKRNLTDTHAVGDAVTLTFSAQEPLTPTRKVSRSVQTSLSGARETIYNTGVWSFDIITAPVASARGRRAVHVLPVGNASRQPVAIARSLGRSAVDVPA